MKYELIPCSRLEPEELIEFLAEAREHQEECNPLWLAERIGIHGWLREIGDSGKTEHEHYLAFTVEGRLAGVCRVTRHPNHIENGQVGIYIRPGMRGKMYAPVFIRMVQDSCREIGLMAPTACCDIMNRRAIAAFRRAGWIPTTKHYNWTGGRTAIELVPGQ